MIVKGNDFSKTGHVLNIISLMLKDKFLQSMKKSVLYDCFIGFNKDGKVVTITLQYDGWPAGIHGRCNHVASTIQYFHWRSSLNKVKHL